MNNKKGLSAIVATVLIILLVIAAVTLVWGPVRNMINKQSEEIEANCLMANPSIDSACQNATGLYITISNGAEVDIDDFQIIYGVDDSNMADSFDSASGVGKNAIVTIANTSLNSSTETIGAVRIAAIIEDKTCGAGQVKAVATSC